ncbi:MAG: thiamine biosynthesis protein ThiS [Alphaproteobacteria bacterium TMED62]|nr:MAG: thiamine biosynthesis protein ThiS [Alphaproteobacteria bacterium TMED62]|tara:strand:+ start:11484 stop:11699 length:216 start_codon:yes stop_codon:yes gene_type:complete
MKNKKIQIYINGKKKNINVNDNLNNILEDFSIKNKLVAIELNEEVVPKSKYKTKRISQNDRIEILELIGGG